MQNTEIVPRKNLFICLNHWCTSQLVESCDWYWMWALPKWQNQLCHLETVYTPRDNVRNIVIEYCHMLYRWIVSSQWQHIPQKRPLRKSEDRSLSFQSSRDCRSKFQLEAIKEREHLALLWTTRSFYSISHYYVSYHNERKTKNDPKI